MLFVFDILQLLVIFKADLWACFVSR